MPSVRFVERFDLTTPRFALAIIDLAQIQNRTLHHPTARTAPAFDNAPVTVLLAVLPSPCESQVHGPRFYAQTKTRKEGRSSLHAFPPHRPLKRLAFSRKNSKIRRPVGKVGLARRVVPEYPRALESSPCIGLSTTSRRSRMASTSSATILPSTSVTIRRRVSGMVVGNAGRFIASAREQIGTMRLRSTNPKLLLIWIIRSGVRRTVSITASSAIPNTCCPASTTIIRDNAMLSGRSRRTVVPRP